MSKPVRSMYDDKRWKRLREAVLRRDEYMCQYALKLGHKVPADTVHHAYPIEQYPEYRWQPWNLVSLSAEAHNMMHDRNTGELTEIGEQLRKHIGQQNGIEEADGTILVIGMPGAGKTTYVKKRLGNGVVFDLDYIAGALRLREPKTDKLRSPRWIANQLVAGFPEAAHKYCALVYVIRTAPTLDEIERINPTKLVVIRGGYGNEELTDKRRHTIATRIQEAVRFAESMGIEVEDVEDTRPHSLF